jgi:threonine dehydrogenase-like Zn-dependent dehydrogenase
MKAIVNTAVHTLEMLEYPMPQPGAGQVRIRTGACGICATDIEMIDGWARTGHPATPGHEWSGTVDAVGVGVEAALLNRRCVAENVLVDGGEVGFEHPGGYGQYLLTDAPNVQVLPDDFPFATAAMIEPLAVSVRAMSRLGQAPSTALVFGDGPIGLLMTALLARAGVRDIAVVGGREARLQVARSLGAQQTVNYHDISGDMATAIRNMTQNAFPVVIEATGNATALRAGMDIVAREGKCLMIGDYGLSHADFLWNIILLKEITLLGSNASAGAWPEAIRLATNGDVPLERLITHCVPAVRFADGMAITRSRRPDVIKVVMNWE